MADDLIDGGFKALVFDGTEKFAEKVDGVIYGNTQNDRRGDRHTDIYGNARITHHAAYKQNGRDIGQDEKQQQLNIAVDQQHRTHDNEQRHPNGDNERLDNAALHVGKDRCLPLHIGTVRRVFLPPRFDPRYHCQIFGGLLDVAVKRQTQVALMRIDAVVDLHTLRQAHGVQQQVLGDKIFILRQGLVAFGVEYLLHTLHNIFERIAKAHTRIRCFKCLFKLDDRL